MQSDNFCVLNQMSCPEWFRMNTCVLHPYPHGTCISFRVDRDPTYLPGTGPGTAGVMRPLNHNLNFESITFSDSIFLNLYPCFFHVGKGAFACTVCADCESHQHFLYSIGHFCTEVIVIIPVLAILMANSSHSMLSSVYSS